MKGHPKLSIENLQTAFESTPKFGLAVLALNTVRELKIPKREWPSVAVLGFFYQQYQREYNIAYPFSTMNDVRADWVEVDALVDSMGASDVLKCIEVLFGPDMAWAKTKTIRLLTRSENRNKFLLPLMAKLKRVSRGEFSEFSGSRSAEFTVKKL